MLLTQAHLFIGLVAVLASLLGGYQLRGYVDSRAANRRTTLLDDVAADLTELESFHKDSSGATEEAARAASEAAKLKSIKERMAALQG